MSIIHARTACFLQCLMQTRIYCWQPKVPKLGSGSLLHWELYRVNRKLLVSGISVYSFSLEIVKFIGKTFPIQTASTITSIWIPAITLAQIPSWATSHLPQNWISEDFCWGWLRKNWKRCLSHVEQLCRVTARASRANTWVQEAVITTWQTGISRAASLAGCAS